VGEGAEGDTRGLRPRVESGDSGEQEKTRRLKRRNWEGGRVGCESQARDCPSASLGRARASRNWC
jgi:hypothetical protein